MENHISPALKRYNYLFGETDAIYHEIAFKLGLSDSASRILYAICDNGTSCLLQDICKYSGLSKQTVNSAIRKLEAEGIIYLEAAGSKNKKVCLTKNGEKLAERTACKILQAENDIFASWPQEDVQKYLELTEAFLLALREKAKHILDT
ncbi:MAG: MarR family transcriptional regulator [Kineothrix sp.]|nr:MarR family transcriptional regulator [Kineothrix sp.]